MIYGINLSDYEHINQHILKAHSLGCGALQVFLGSKTLTTLSEKWKPIPEEIKITKDLLKKYKIQLYVHGLLTLNYCNDPSSKRNQWGLTNLLYDMNLLQKLGGKACVIHMGHHITKKIKLSKNECMVHFVESLQYILDHSKKVQIYLETPAHKKNIIGSTLEELATLYHMIPLKYQKRVQFCMDTCHIYASGYNIATMEGMKSYFEEFQKQIGLKHLRLIHLNDSQGALNSQVNRHASLGNGFIFHEESKTHVLQELLNVAKKWKIPIILETPPSHFRKNISLIMKSQSGGNKKYNNKYNKKKDKKAQLLTIFQNLKDYYETLAPKNAHTSFRIDSYQKIVHTLENHKGLICTLENVQSLPHMGKKTMDKIAFILEHGHLPQHNEIQEDLKKIKAAKELQTIFGIGPEFSKKLVLEDHVLSIANLKKKVSQKKIVLSDQQQLGLQYYRDLQLKIPAPEITYTSDIIKSWLPSQYNLHNAGSYIMKKKFSGDIDLIITYKDPIFPLKKNDSISNQEKESLFIYDLLKEKKLIQEILIQGKEKSTYIIKIPNSYSQFKPHKYRQMDLAVIPQSYFYFYMLYFGSSRNFSKYIRKMASSKGYKLNEKGLFDKKTGKKIALQPTSEKDIFDFLEIPYVQHEDRVL
jgi:apurinic endonuclease APN1